MTDIADPRKTINKISKWKHPLYSTWAHMNYRCYNSKGKRYSEWGGRGITVCDAWRHNFQAFADYMGPKPAPEYSIDRINNDGNYEPGNVRWATPRQQVLNSSHAVMLTYNDKTQCLKDWANELGFSYKCITKRYQAGKSVEDILLPPSKKSSKIPEPRGYFYKGKWKSIRELAAITGMRYGTLLRRYEHGFNLNRALTQRVRQITEFIWEGKLVSLKEWSRLVEMPYTSVRQWIAEGKSIEEIYAYKRPNEGEGCRK